MLKWLCAEYMWFFRNFLSNVKHVDLNRRSKQVDLNRRSKQVDLNKKKTCRTKQKKKHRLKQITLLVSLFTV